MEKNSRPALKPCRKKGQEQTGSVLIDGLSQLPDDILVFIMSFLTMKEAARTSLVSSKWKILWGYFPKLNFEAPNMEDRSQQHERYYRLEKFDYKLVGEERSKFVRWVDFVLKQHLGQVIDELRVVIDLDNSFQSHLDKWVELTLAKHVKRMELRLGPKWRFRSRNLDERKHIRFPVKCCVPGLSNGWQVFNCSLLSLHLSYVELSAEDVGCLLRFFTHLENLCIERLESLPCITVSDVSLRLKKLEVFHCRCLTTIDISSPNLSSFRYWGGPIKLNFRNAFLLSELCIAGYLSYPVTNAFDCLSNYLSQLKYLQLKMILEKDSKINHSLTLANLKHLELIYLSANPDNSVLGWIPLIEASPLLEKLTIKVDIYRGRVPSSMRMVKCDGQRLKSLKELELVAFVGQKIELDLLTYVLQNSVLLEKVIILSVHPKIHEESNLESRERIMGL